MRSNRNWSLQGLFEAVEQEGNVFTVPNSTKSLANLPSAVCKYNILFRLVEDDFHLAKDLLDVLLSTLNLNVDFGANLGYLLLLSLSLE